MLLTARSQHRMQQPEAIQLLDIERGLAETKRAFARRVGRHAAHWILNGLAQPNVHTQAHFAGIAQSERQLCTLFEINGVPETDRTLALQACWRRLQERLK